MFLIQTVLIDYKDLPGHAITPLDHSLKVELLNSKAMSKFY